MSISCDNYDYIEIACLYTYLLELQLTSGAILTGRAITTGIDECKQEYLLLEIQAENELHPALNQQVPLDQLSTMQVLTANARFQQVVF